MPLRIIWMEPVIHPGWDLTQIDRNKTWRVGHQYLVGAYAPYAREWDGVRSAVRETEPIVIMDSPASAVPAMVPGDAGNVMDHAWLSDAALTRFEIARYGMLYKSRR